MRLGIIHKIDENLKEELLFNKILFLLNNNSEVKLFLNKVPANFELCHVYTGYEKNTNKVLKKLASIIAIFRLILNFRRAYRLWALNKNDGISLKINILYLLNSAHILMHNLDWLYFSNASLSVSKANLARAINAKMAVSFTAYDLLITSQKEPFIFLNVIPKIDKVHFFSKTFEQYFLKFEIKSSPKVKVINNALNVNNFFNSNSPQSLNYLVKRKVFNSEKLVLCSIAKLDWKSGLDYIFETLAILKSVTSNFEFKIIGSGDDFERLKFSAHQLGLESNIRFIEHLDNNSINYELLNSDIYIQYNNLMDDFDVSIIRAQLMDCITIVSSAYGLDDSIVHGKTGFIVTKRSPILLFETILEILKLDTESIKKIQEESRITVLTVFNSKRQEKEINEFYSL